MMADNLAAIKAEVAKLTPKAGDLLAVTIRKIDNPLEDYHTKKDLTLWANANYPEVRFIIITEGVKLELLDGEDLARIGLKRVGD
jgi:Na+/H+ antiporter NhaA